MKQRYEIILGGSGGQGMVLSGRVLGLAAILEGKNVAQTQSVLGDAQRGGLSTAEVVIDKEEITFQQVEEPDVILALGDMAVKKFATATPRIAMIYESGLADLGKRNGLYAFPFAELSARHGYASNMIALGTIVALAGPVSFESMEKAIRQSLHGPAAEKNLEAVRFGMQLAGHTPQPAGASDAPGKRAQSV
ncbi:MAG: 2-oxoacid:acceptor oxidoreductase family protein [Candidatus Korobacteraceae bacterium]